LLILLICNRKYGEISIGILINILMMTIGA